MSFAEFLQFIGNGIAIFINNFAIVANNLIQNYFIITLLGLTIFVSLVWCVYNLIIKTIEDNIGNYEEYNDRMKNYKLNQEIKKDYLDKNYGEAYEYWYKVRILQTQITNGIMQKNKDLILENKLSNFKLNAEALIKYKGEVMSDTDKENNNDPDMFSNIPIPRKTLASRMELHKNKRLTDEELKLMHIEAKNEINAEIDRIEEENKNLIGG